MQDRFHTSQNPAPPSQGLRFSLAVQVVGLLMAISVPTLTGLGLVARERNRQALTVDALQAERLLADLTTGAISTELELARTSMSTIGAVLTAPDLAGDQARLKLASAQLQAWGGSRLVTLYAGPQGRRQGSLRTEAGAGTTPPEVLPEALRGAALTAGEVRWRGERPVLELSQALGEPGQPAQAWLYAELELASLQAKVQALGEAPPLRDAAAIFVVDQDRALVLGAQGRPLGASMADHGLFAAVSGRPDFHRAFALSSDFSHEGQARLGALTTLPELGWAVVVQQPSARAYQTLRALEVWVASAVALAMVLSLVAGTLGARRLVGPLRRLVEAAHRIGARAFTRVDPSVSGRGDEVGDLARAVDEMSGQLERSEAQLVRETQVRAALSRYLSNDVVDLVVKAPELLKLGGEQRQVTVLFADVVGFTRLSESLPPETIVAVLNELFTFATEIVRQHGGIIDKFIGDCVMAVWGVPVKSGQDAKLAVNAALALRRWVETGNRRWKAAYGVEVRLAMGLHTGPAVAGNVGSEQRMEYTVIGDTVNVAARLEAFAAPNQILVSEQTWVEANLPSTLQPVGTRNLRGRDRPVMLYEARE